METSNNKETSKLAEKETETIRRGKTLREDHAKATENLLQKQTELVELQKQQIELEKDSVKNQDEILKNKKEIAKVSISIEISEKKLNELEEKSKKNQEELKKYREDREKKEKDSEKRFDRSEKAEKRLTSLKRETNVEMDRSAELMKKMGANANGLSKSAGISSGLFEQQTNILAQSENILKSQGFLTEDFVRNLEIGRDVTHEISSLEAEILAQTNDASVGKYKSVDLTKQEESLNRKLVDLMDENSELTSLEKTQAIALVEIQQKSLANLKSKNTQLEEMSKQAEKTLGVFEKFTSFDFKGGISQYFGLDKLKSDMKDKLGKTVLDVTSAVRGEKGLVGGFKAAASGLGSMVKMAPKFGLGLAIGGIVAGIGALVKGVMHADEEVANMGKELGISHHEAGKLHGQAQRMSAEMNIAGINAKELYEGIKIAGDAMGGIDIGAQLAAGNKEIEGFVKQSAILSKQFGLSGEEISQIKDIATMTGKSMDTLVKESVELGAGTITAKQSMKTLASIPPQVTVAFKGSTKELIAAAQKAKLLGTELGKIQQIGMGMLEIEDSLGKEMEARVLTGKNLNLDAARQYALEGNTFKLQEEILNQAGSLQDFSKMNTIQQKSFADAMGMSVEEMTKMLTNAEKLKNANIDSSYADKLSKMQSAADLEKEMAEQKKMGASKEKLDYIQQLANEKRSASLKEKMADMMEKIKARLSPIVEKVMEMAHSFFDGAKGASQFDNIIASIDIESIVESVKEALPKIIEFVTKLIKELPNIIKFITTVVDKVSMITGSLNPSIAGFGLLAFKIGGPKGVADGLKLAGQGAMGLFGVIKGPLTEGVGKLAGGVTDKLGGAFDRVSDKAKGGLGKIMEKMGKGKKPDMPDAVGAKKGGIGDSIADFTKKVDGKQLIMVAVAMVIFAGALYVAAKAFQEFGKVNWENAWPGIAVMGGMVIAALALGKAKKEAMIGAAAILVLSAALLVTAIALNMFGTVNFESVLIGVGALGVLALMAVGLGMAGPMALLGAAAILVLGLAMMAFGEGAKKLGEALAAATPAITAFFDGLSGVVESVGSVIVNAINAIGDQINKVIDKLLALGNLDPGKLLAIAGSITTLGAALAAFGGGSGVGAIADGFGSLAGKLMGGNNPFDAIMEITKKLNPQVLNGIVDGIKGLTNAIKEMASELAKLDTSGIDKSVQSIDKIRRATKGDSMVDVAKDAIGGAANAVGSFASGAANAVGGLFGFASGGQVGTGGMAIVGEQGPEIVKLPGAATVASTSVSSQISNVVGGIGGGDNSGGTNMSKVEQKLDTLIGLFGQVANQPTVIKFGEKVVDEINSQINFKKAYQIGLDNTYGRTV